LCIRLFSTQLLLRPPRSILFPYTTLFRSGSSSNDDASAGGCEPSAEECASGNACGSCSLNGACEGGGAAFDAGQGTGAGAGQGSQQGAAKPALDLDAARRAMAEQDRR